MEEIIELEAIVGPQSELKELAKSFGEKRDPEKVLYWMRKVGKVPKKYMKYQSLSLKQAKIVTKNFKELSTVDISNLDAWLFQNAVTSVTSGSSKATKNDKIRILELLRGYPGAQALLWTRALGSLTRTELLDAKYSKIAKNDEDENDIVRRDAWKALVAIFNDKDKKTNSFQPYNRVVI
jgi:hypothetical protein